MTRAIQIRQHGGPEELQLVDVQVGQPGPGEVRIRHHAIGLNFIDVYHRTGLYPLPMPATIGMEAAGVVEAVGAGVAHLAEGDRVAYASNPPGSYCEARVLPAMNVCKLPDAIDFETGAAMMLKGLTAQYLLKKTRPVEGLQPGDHVLFHAAAGGVGLIACQWARALGLQLIATAGSDDKCRLALANGAAHAINYRQEDFAARVKDITGGRGVKVVYDSVGKDTWDKSLDCLRPFGLMASFGNASGRCRRLRPACWPRVRCTSRARRCSRTSPRARPPRPWPTSCSMSWPAGRSGSISSSATRLSRCSRRTATWRRARPPARPS